MKVGERVINTLYILSGSFPPLLRSILVRPIPSPTSAANTALFFFFSFFFKAAAAGERS